MKKIHANDLLCLDAYQDHFPVKIQLVYAVGAPPNIFGQVYHENAKLWLHKELAQIVLLASLLIKKEKGWSLILYDGLRTLEAQEAMSQSDIVKNNPHWLQEPGRLLSPPGAGAHPRGMAVDLSCLDEQGELVDMGTEFDYLAENSNENRNPAHRSYIHLTETVKNNRDTLNQVMGQAAETVNIELLMLPQEWWDFRFPPHIYEQFEPLADEDLPADIKMCTKPDQKTFSQKPYYDDSFAKKIKSNLAT